MRSRLIALLIAVIAVLVPAIALGAAVSQDDLDRCIARNSLRFDQPGDALAAQYVDIAAACRASLAKKAAATVTVSGGGGGKPPTPSGSAGRAGDVTPTAPPPSVAPAKKPPAKKPSASPVTTANAQVINTALARDAADPAGPLAGLGALPWQYWLGISLAVVVVAALGLRSRWRRTADTE